MFSIRVVRFKWFTFFWLILRAGVGKKVTTSVLVWWGTSITAVYQREFLGRNIEGVDSLRAWVWIWLSYSNQYSSKKTNFGEPEISKLVFIYSSRKKIDSAKVADNRLLEQKLYVKWVSQNFKFCKLPFFGLSIKGISKTLGFGVLAKK